MNIPNPTKKMAVWRSIMSLHSSSGRVRVSTVAHLTGINTGDTCRHFRFFAAEGLLRRESGGKYYVVKEIEAESLSDDVLWKPIDRTIYDRTTPPAHNSAPKPKPIAPRAESATAVPEPITGYRIITCANCGRSTVDHRLHQCIAGWQIMPHRTICPSCASGRPPIEAKPWTAQR